MKHLRRPGRFDREIEIGIPKEEDRLEILKIHSRSIPITAEIDKKIFKSFIAEKFEIILKEKQNSEEKIENELNTIKKSKLSLSEKIKSIEETKKKINKELSEISEKIKYYKSVIQKNDWEPFTIRKYQKLKFDYDNKKKELENYSGALKEFLNKKSASMKKEEDIESNYKKNYVHRDKMNSLYEKLKKNDKIFS